MSKPYVGRSRDTGKRVVFRSDVEPTEELHGKDYTLVTGPFRTVRGARFFASYGFNNPHCTCVADAERLALKASGE